MKKGKTYLLFLRSIADTTDGTTWVYTGSPSVAEVDGGLATFSQSDEYRQSLPPGSTGLANVSVADIEAIIKSPPPPPTPVQSTSEGQSITARGAALEQLVGELPQIADDASLSERIHQLKLDPQSLQDSAFCNKVNTVIEEQSNFLGPLDCQASE